MDLRDKMAQLNGVVRCALPLITIGDAKSDPSSRSA
jgi:hypothetical protein